MRSIFFFPLYSSLALSGKLADLGCLHSLSQAGVCPAVAGGGSVGLVGSDGQGQTRLDSESPVLRSETILMQIVGILLSEFIAFKALKKCSQNHDPTHTKFS